MKKFLVTLKDPTSTTTMRYEKQKDILVSTAEIFTVLLGQSYFMPLAITSLAILSRLIAFVIAEKDKLETSRCNVNPKAALRENSLGKGKTLVRSDLLIMEQAQVRWAPSTPP